MTTYDLITTRAHNEGFEVGIQKGIEMGIKKGIEKGIEKGKIETILNAFYKGHPISLIADITSMTIEVVTRILKEHGRLD